MRGGTVGWRRRRKEAGTVDDTDGSNGCRAQAWLVSESSDNKRKMKKKMISQLRMKRKQTRREHMPM